ncbi:hypothetical protein K0J45_13385 [Shewanella alkalitolerans]|uniref:hypothetical protein n=1 Tax=Shewanella alkalitolerans TaxID=2864209 RepID=UPI001C65F773|nr:hypothetical protein [Shewanella alkalitolerans]QYJ96527.1 hypothetical protein K0J45_13385 [Shewanella alkalitolerans]
MKFLIFRHYWWVFSVLILLVLGVTFVLGIECDSKLVFPLVGTYLSAMYFVQKQKLEETKLFREIFAECNKRYDELNDKLNEIIRSSEESELTSDQKNLLDDYFNLCGEEYFYFQEGYIYPDVWESWMNGMKTIINTPKIKRHWIKESESGSYYGLDFGNV